MKSVKGTKTEQNLLPEKTKNGANSIPNLPKWPMKKDFLKLPKLSAASQQSKPDMKPATSNSTNV